MESKNKNQEKKNNNEVVVTKEQALKELYKYTANDYIAWMTRSKKKHYMNFEQLMLFDKYLDQARKAGATEVEIEETDIKATIYAEKFYESIIEK